MIEDPVPVIIGGETYRCPPMPFYCLERAWPHIQAMGRMGAANQALAAAELQLRTAKDAPARAEAAAHVEAARALISTLGADFIGQTHEAVAIIVAALSLQSPAPSYTELSQKLRPSEIAGLHIACGLLLDRSGLTERGPGEASATNRTTASLLNGHDSSPSLQPTA